MAVGRGKDRDTRTSGGRHATYPSEDQRCAPATLTQLQFGRSIPDNEHRPTDWRFDFVPFKARPLIEVQTDKFLCTDIGFLIEKMHSGVYWAIFDGLSEAERPRLFKAWGILFEEYVNWFLTDRALTTPLLFYSAPKWRDGREYFDGAFVQDSRFMPMEYKGGFIKIEARYSGNPNAFESDLDLKIAEGCQQLASDPSIWWNANRGRLRVSQCSNRLPGQLARSSRYRVDRQFDRM